MEDCKPGKCGKDRACDRKTKRCKPKKSVSGKIYMSPLGSPACKPGKCGKDMACDRKTQRCKPKGKKATMRKTPPVIKEAPRIPTPPAILTLSPAVPNRVSSSSPVYVGLTKDNLIKLGLRPATPKQDPPVKRAKITNPNPAPKNMSEKMFEKEKGYYYVYLDDFKNGHNAEIYDVLVNIAKRKYSKYENVKEFQEEFYQNFMKIDDDYDSYSEEDHKKLEKLRAKADSLA